MYTPAQKAKILELQGFDPAQYDIDDQDNIIEKSQLPTRPQAPTPALTTSTAGALGRSAKRSLIPTLTGLAGAGVATALSGGGALIPILAGIAGGMAGGYGQEKLVEATSTPEELQARNEQMALDQAQHPYASFGGAIAPQLLAFQPNLANIGRAGRTLLRGGDAAAKANLANVGVGAGLGAVTEGVLPYLQGGEASARDVGLGALAGAAFNKPWLLGKRLFPSGQPELKGPQITPRGWESIDPVASLALEGNRPNYRVSPSGHPTGWYSIDPSSMTTEGVVPKYEVPIAGKLQGWNAIDPATLANEGIPPRYMQSVAGKLSGWDRVDPSTLANEGVPPVYKPSLQSRLQGWQNIEPGSLAGEGEAFPYTPQDTTATGQLSKLVPTSKLKPNLSVEPEVKIPKVTEISRKLEDLTEAKVAQIEKSAELNKGEVPLQKAAYKMAKDQIPDPEPKPTAPEGDPFEGERNRLQQQTTTKSGGQQNLDDAITQLTDNRRIIDTLVAEKANTPKEGHAAIDAKIAKFRADQAEIVKRIQDISLQTAQDIATKKQEVIEKVYPKQEPTSTAQDKPLDILEGGDTQNAQKERVQEIASSQQVGTEVTKVPTEVDRPYAEVPTKDLIANLAVEEEALRKYNELKARGRLSSKSKQEGSTTVIKAIKLELNRRKSDWVNTGKLQGELTPIAKSAEVQQAPVQAINPKGKILRYVHTLEKNRGSNYNDVVIPIHSDGKGGTYQGKPIRNFGTTGKRAAQEFARQKTEELGDIRPYGDITTEELKRRIDTQQGYATEYANPKGKLGHARKRSADRKLAELKKELAIREGSSSLANAPAEVQAADTQIRKGLKTKGTKPSRGEQGSIINPGEVIYDALVTVGRHLATIYKDFTAWSKAMLDNYGGEVSKYIKSVWENISGMPSIPALKGKSPETGTPRPYDQIKLGGEGNKVYSDLGTTNPQSLVSKIFSSQTETLRKTGGKGGKVFADAATEQNEVARGLFKFSNRMMDALKGLRPDEYNQVYKALIYEGRNKVSMRNQLPEYLRPVYDVARREYKNMGLNQIEAKQPKLQNGVPVERGIDPLAWFETMNRKTLNTIGKYPDSPAAKQLKQDFIDHYKTQGKSESEAVEDFTNLTNALNSKDTNVRFAALRKSEGIGLPDSWIEPDFKQAIKRYVRRFASDRAYYDTIESNPEVMWLLGQAKDSYGREMPKPANPPGEFGSLKLNPEVKSILEQIEGNYARFSPTVNALSRVANALILGPITGMTDIMSTPFNMAKFLPTRELAGMFGTIKNIGQSYRNSLETGINRRDFTTIDELAQVGTELSDEINKRADFITRATGRQATEIVSRSIAQGMGEYIAKFHQAMAKAGDKASIKLLNEVSPGKDWSKLDYKELGARFAELAQGRYNFTGLPRWANDSLLAPLVKLSRWNIEQAGNFMKYVWEPLKAGNPEPLLISLLGGVVGGTMIKELREYITEKEGNTPTWIEIAQSEGSMGDKIPATAYELMAVMGLVGSAGAFADIIKSGFDVVYKNTPSGYRLPLYETTANVAKNITQATGAILDADSLKEVGDIALKLSLNLMSQNVQLLRIGVNNLAVAAPNTMLGKEHKRKGEARDLRVFNMLEGNRQGSGGSADNPYTGLVARRYKLAETPQEALAAIGPAINKVRAQSKGNPRKLLRGLDNLKTSASLDYPSPERNPEDFVKFGRFLQGTQGKARADERLESYKRRRAVNRMKSNLLP